MQIPLYIVDTFTSPHSAGNPAAVCPLSMWPQEKAMQRIAAENRHSETAFFKENSSKFELRWFTPTTEVELCGHATLATAFVLSEVLLRPEESFHFSTRSGILSVTRYQEMYCMDFPARPLERLDMAGRVGKILGAEVVSLSRAGPTYIAELGDAAAVRAVQPDFDAIRRLDCQGLIITAPGEQEDFVSRFFGPRVGIDEDPVTGSAHCGLIPFWSERLGKKVMTARQLSERGGDLHCELRNGRVVVGGRAALYSTGSICL